MIRSLKILFHRDFWPVLAVLLLGILASRTLIFQSGYFRMHDDLQMMRQLQMEKCFLDAQIPCRWVPDMGFGYGFPLFNFYPPLPYLVGEIFRLMGFAFTTAVKLTFAVAMIASGVSMYYLAKVFFGRMGGFLAAAFYIWAPYHAVDVYVRGAMNESWALVFFPLIFLAAYRLVAGKNKFKWLALLAVSYALLLLSHNLMVLIFTPILAGWVAIHLIKIYAEENFLTRLKKVLPYLILAGVWAFGLAAFFTLPALLENQMTHIETALTGYFNYPTHFVSIRQLLFSRFWGYEGSVWGVEADGMSFQIGHIHWILSLLIGIFLLVRLAKTVKKHGPKSALRDKILLVSFYMLVIGWFSAFLTHQKSYFFWENISALSYLQFPWRFLSLVIFAFSFVIGFLPSLIHSDKKLFDYAFIPVRFLLTLVFVIFLLIFNWNYFLPYNGKMGPLTDEEKFSGEAWILQQKAGIYDYLPKTAQEAPKSAQEVTVQILTGDGELENVNQGTYWVYFDADLNKKSLVRINIFDFPDWEVYVDDKQIETFIPEEEKLGRIHFNLPEGKHKVYAQLMNTKVRTIGNILSIASWSILAITILKKKRA